MNERNKAKLLSRLVDGIVSGGSTPESPILPLENAAELRIARLLGRADFTEKSLVLGTLPEKIRSTTPLMRRTWPGTMARFLVRPLPLAMESILVLVVVLQCSWPGGIPGMAKNVRDAIVYDVRLGPSTAVVKIDSAKVRYPLEGRIDWSIYTPVGALGGSVPAGTDPAVLTYATYEEARRAAPRFDFLIPRLLPVGYSLARVQLAPTRDWLVATYASRSGQEIVFSVRSDASDRTVVAGDPAMVVVKAGVAEFPAAWVGSQMVVWEKGNVSYTVGGRGLSLEDARGIAASVR